jgi:hypothetical protein
VDFVGAAQGAGVVGAGKGEGGVSDEPGVEAEVAGHADGGFDGVIRDDAADDEAMRAGGPQGVFEASADEGAVDVFDDDGFAGEGAAQGLKSQPWPGR